MDDHSQQILACQYVKRENYNTAKQFFLELRQRGLNPQYAVLDGHRQVLRAIDYVWSGIKIQRCLYHIQREGMRWLRSRPKSEAGRELRSLLSTLTSVETKEQREEFERSYLNWKNKHEKYIESLPSQEIVFKDLKKTRSLLNNAGLNMFHYLESKQKISSTTNKLEGFFSRLKSDYRRHRGLSLEHRISYLYWYCYLKN